MINLSLLQEYQPHEYFRAVLIGIDETDKNDSENGENSDNSFFETMEVQERLKGLMQMAGPRSLKRHLATSTQQEAKKTKITATRI